MLLAAVSTLALPDCHKEASPIPDARAPIATAATAATTTTTTTTPTTSCGTSPTDWCPSPPGDPCGRHPNVASCRADKACKGMPYRGESVVACMDDGSGFAKNCPTVGCISR
jgi:hypothetical protein